MKQSKLTYGFIALFIVLTIGLISATNNINENNIQTPSLNVSNISILGNGNLTMWDGNSYRGVSSGTADVVVCRGTSWYDDIYKSSKLVSGCDVVCPSTSNSCQTYFTTAFNKLTSNRNYKQKIIAKGIFNITDSISIPSYTSLIVDGIIANGLFDNIFESSGKNNIDLLFNYIDSTNFVNSTAISALYEDTYGSNIYVGGINGYGIVNNSGGGLQISVHTYCLSTSICKNIVVENLNLLDIQNQGLLFDDYSNVNARNIIIDSDNGGIYDRTRYGVIVSRNVNTVLDNILILYVRNGGIYDTGNTKGLTINNVRIYFNGTTNIDQDGMEIGVLSQSIGSTTDVKLTNNYIDNPLDVGILIYNNTYGFSDSNLCNRINFNKYNTSDCIQDQNILYTSFDIRDRSFGTNDIGESGMTYINTDVSKQLFNTSSQIYGIKSNTSSIINLISDANSDNELIGGIMSTRTRGQGDAHKNLLAMLFYQSGTGVAAGSYAVFKDRYSTYASFKTSGITSMSNMTIASGSRYCFDGANCYYYVWFNSSCIEVSNNGVKHCI